MKVVFWKKKTINNGEQFVTELTVLEWKELFSIKLFNFHKTNGKQDRFHTHSFNAVSLLLTGNYIEEVVENFKVLAKPRNRSKLLYIPKGEYHRITKSDGCRTLLITGPWEPEWVELRELGNSHYQEVFCGAGRTDLRTGNTIKLED